MPLAFPELPDYRFEMPQTRPKNPYATDLGRRNPLTALAAAPDHIRSIVDGWSTAQWERTYAPGKWTARQILIHLVQSELALTTRVRYAASKPGYVAQPFSQDDWMEVEKHTDGRIALEAYTCLRRLNVALFRNLTTAQRTRTFTHPEYGRLTPEWVAAQMAGHDLHHLKQLEAIAGT
jgi:DinB family protein